MQSLLSPLAQGLTPYTPGEQPKERRYIKLNTNENPYPPSPAIAGAVEEVIRQGRLNLYPPAECEPLRELIARQERLPGKEWVYFGNGSDEVLAFCFQAFFSREKPLRMPDISYSFYPVYCSLYQLPFTSIPLKADFSVDVQDYAGPGGGIVLANPNAPTALALPPDQLEALIASHPHEVVLVDEAYAGFSDYTAAAWIPRYPNLIVTRTCSKSHGLAGLRVGYCMGNPELIEGIIRVKNSFNSYTMDMLAQTAAYQALADEDYTRQTRRKVLSARARFAARLKELGFVGPESSANFVFTRHPSIPGETLFTALRQRGILVRRFSQPARVADYLRITIGTPEDMDTVAQALAEIQEAMK